MLHYRIFAYPEQRGGVKARLGAWLKGGIYMFGIRGVVSMGVFAGPFIGRW